MPKSLVPGATDVLKSFDLRGRTAAITGGGGELCGAMAQALSGMGVRVAVLDLVGSTVQMFQRKGDAPVAA